VNYACDFYGVLGHAVNDEKRKRRHRQFPRAIHASQPAAMGKRAQRSNIFVNCPRDSLSGGSIFSANVINNLEKVLRSGG